MIVFNFVGLGMCLIGFGIAFGVRALTGSVAEPLLMIIGGIIAATLDVLYRAKSARGHWIHPHGGGSLFFLPVWLFGIVWLAIGTARIIMGKS